MKPAAPESVWLPYVPKRAARINAKQAAWNLLRKETLPDKVWRKRLKQLERKHLLLEIQGSTKEGIELGVYLGVRNKSWTQEGKPLSNDKLPAFFRKIDSLDRIVLAQYMFWKFIQNRMEEVCIEEQDQYRDYDWVPEDNDCTYKRLDPNVRQLAEETDGLRDLYLQILQGQLENKAQM